ncbi:MAG: hypothetical protein GX810_01200 [Clostridiales bacterium]|nr:hypothetical protein [Clostridiales bacterium]
MPYAWIQPREDLKALARDPRYADVVSGMRERVNYWQTNFADTPEQKCGWLHNYVCPKCTGYLHFDADRPDVHECPECHIRVENTREIMEAWVYLKRFQIAERLKDAAVLYRMDGQPEDLAFITRVVDFYAPHYVQFEEYGIYAGRGRIMGQSLCEAVWSVNVLKALLIAGFDGKSAQCQRWHHLLFLPIARLVVAQTGMIHNIPLWHAVAAFCAGVFFGDERLVRTTLGGDLGLTQQVTQGFTRDGIWFENSSGYHYYAMAAATGMCVFARWAGMEETMAEVFRRVIAAYTALPRLAFQDGTLTAFNDSSRTEGRKGIASQRDLYLEGARLFAGMEGAEDIAALIAGHDVEGTRGAFLFGVPKATGHVKMPASIHLKHNCVGVLRAGDIEVFVKYGNLSRSHAHPDALQISLPGFSDDPGVPGYGSPFHRGWYTQTLAHNTFVVDSKSQRPDARGQGELSDDGNSFDMRVTDAYPGVTATRALTAAGNTLTDRMTVTCEEEHTIDWVFHASGEADFTGQMAPATLPEQDNGYNYLADVQKVTGPFAARFLRDGKTLSLALDELPADAAIYVAISPDNPATLKRHTIIVRTRAKEVAVAARYTVM